MTKEFLEELELGDEVAEAILQRHTQTVQKLQFDHSLQQAIAAAGGRNAKAITALLDLEVLQADPEGIAPALEQLKKENSYLFETPAPPPYARFTGTRETAANEPQTLAGALRERMKKN